MAVDWQQVKEEAAKILSGYIQADTTNPPGREIVGARFLQGILEKEGLSPTLLESQPDRGNLICSMKGTESEPPIVLLHHIDDFRLDDIVYLEFAQCIGTLVLAQL